MENGNAHFKAIKNKQDKMCILYVEDIVDNSEGIGFVSTATELIRTHMGILFPTRRFQEVMERLE